MSNKITIDEIIIDDKSYDIKPPYEVDVIYDDGFFMAEGEEEGGLDLFSESQTYKGLIKDTELVLQRFYKSYVLCAIEPPTKDAVKLRHDLIERFGFWLDGYGYFHKVGS